MLDNAVESLDEYHLHGGSIPPISTKIQPPKGGFDFGRMPEPGEGATKYN